MIFLSSLIPPPPPSVPTSPISTAVAKEEEEEGIETRNEEIPSDNYLLIGQNNVVVGKFALSGDLEEDEKSEKMLVDALPGGLSIIGLLHGSSSSVDTIHHYKKRENFKIVTLNPNSKFETFDNVSDKFVILRLTSPKLLIDQTNVSIPDTFTFSNSLGIGSASNDLLSNKKSLTDAPPIVTVKPLHNIMDGFTFPNPEDNDNVVSFSLNIVCYILRNPESNIGVASTLLHNTLKEKVTQGLNQMKTLPSELSGITLTKKFRISSFPMCSLCVTACFPCSEYALGTKSCTEFRRRVQSGFSSVSGPLMHPLYSVEINWGTESQTKKKKGFVPLRNVHEQIVDVKTSNTNGTLHFVKGNYDYYHYMQGGYNDSGWGCAYRSMQTLCSWLRCGGYTQKQVPKHREIQETLAEIGDKPLSFVGSHNWIGAVEISLCLQQMYGVESRILNVQSGSDIVNFAGEIANHFDVNGSPIMVGGGVLAYTIIGIDWNKETGDVEFLILDPHYTGSDNPQSIKTGGWCEWKKPSLFKKEYFYNLCMPIKPNVI